MSDTCERPGCRLRAAYTRLRADLASRGQSLNEPGAKLEHLCLAHAADVRQDVGGPLWRIESHEQDSTGQEAARAT